MSLEIFLERVQERELPKNPLARIQTLARELAEGAAMALWSSNFDAFGVYNEGRRENDVVADAIYRYLVARWKDVETAPSFDLLARNGYLIAEDAGRFTAVYTLSKAAFDLLSLSEPASIFISYKRSESSAFALLVANVLRQAGLSAFVDMQLEAGGDWREQLRKTIENSDYLVLLLGKETLNSEVTTQEVQWAIAGGTTVIPIWHNGFSFHAADWASLETSLKDLLANTHTIRVTEENPLAYNAAMSQLLNRFGISG